MDDDVDVLVIGGGGAGLMAAVESARRGLRTILVEKQPHLGGTTGLSVGTICTTGTVLQRAAGISDTTDAHFEDLGKFVGEMAHRDNLELRRLLVDHVPRAYEVLCDLGVQFVGPIPEPPHRHPRLHAVVPHSGGYIHHLSRALRKAGGRVMTGAAARSLTLSDGRVDGAEIVHDGIVRHLKARRGVIITSGDLSSAPKDYKARFMSPLLLLLDGINPASTGDGQRLGEETGGVIVNGDLALGPELRFLAPPHPSIINRLPPTRFFAKAVLAGMKILPVRLLRPFLMSFVVTFLAPSPNLFRQGAVLVNRSGERFCDELSRPQDAVATQPEQHAFIVFDQAVAERFETWPNFISTAPGVGYAYLRDYARSRRDIFFKADSWAELGARIGMDGNILAATITERNAGLAEDDDLPPLLKPPFYALGPAKPWIAISEGGLRVDTSMRVLRRDGSPIAGLFAAGSAGQGGVLLDGHGHHLAWAFTSGLLAGAAVAEHATQTPSQTDLNLSGEPR